MLSSSPIFAENVILILYDWLSSDITSLGDPDNYIIHTPRVCHSTECPVAKYCSNAN